MNKLFDIIDKLETTRSLSLEEYRSIIEGFSPEISEYAAKKAVEKR